MNEINEFLKGLVIYGGIILSVMALISIANSLEYIAKKMK